MNPALELNLISKINGLSPQQVAEVENFIEFLSAKSKKFLAMDCLLSVAPALQAAGIAPLQEHEIAAEVTAARLQRRIQQAAKD
jgi:hypothetical protein